MLHFSRPLSSTAGMIARLPALALVALGAVDALPVAKHGSVLDGLRELELDLEALTAVAHRVKRAPSGPGGRSKLHRGETLERMQAGPSIANIDGDEPPAGSLVVYSPSSTDLDAMDSCIEELTNSGTTHWRTRLSNAAKGFFSDVHTKLTSQRARVAVGVALFTAGVLFPPAEVRRSRRAARCTHRPLTRPFVCVRCSPSSQRPQLAGVPTSWRRKSGRRWAKGTNWVRRLS